MADRATLLRNFYDVLGEKRCSGLDSAEVLKQLEPYLQAAEAARTEGRRANAADAFRDAEGAYDKYQSMMESVMRGDLPDIFANTGDSYYKASRPTNSILNTGGQQRVIRVDPMTGEVKEVAAFDNTLTPQQAADNQYRDDVFDYTKQKDARDFKEDQMRWNANREDANRPRYGMPVAAGGKLWQFDQNGNKRPFEFEIDGVQVDAPQGFETWTERDKARLGSLQDELKSIREDIKTWREAYNNAQTDEERQYADNMLRGTLGQDGKRTGGLYAREAATRASILNMFNCPQAGLCSKMARPQ